MSRLDSRVREVLTKIPFFGATGAAIEEIFGAMHSYYPRAKVFSKQFCEMDAMGADFLWAQNLHNDWNLRVKTSALTLKAEYNAYYELLLSEIDGVLFVADVSSEGSLLQALKSMKLMVFNLRRLGYDLSTLPVVMQYYGIDQHEGFSPDLVDSFLEVTPGMLPRFCSKAHDQPEVLCEALDHLVGTIHQQLVTELGEEG